MKKKYVTPKFAILVYQEEEFIAASGFNETDDGFDFGFPGGSGEAGGGNGNDGFDSKRRDSFDDDDDYDPLW